MCEAIGFLRDNTATEILVHVGANYIPLVHPSEVSGEIIDFIDELRRISKGAEVSFSKVLPQATSICGNVNNGIELINSTVEKYLGGTFSAYRFTGKFFDERLLCRDGVHLSVSGVRVMEKALADYMTIRDIYMH